MQTKSPLSGRSNRRRPRHRRAVATGLAISVALAMFLAPSAMAAPIVGGGGTVSYTEQDPPMLIGEDITIGGTSPYGGGHVDFAIGSSGASEFLTLVDDDAPVTVAGAVSIVGDVVYLGNGTGADAIGSVDPTRNGQNGSPLRVNFTSPFTNESFESGDLSGWTVVDEWIDLGVTELPAGHVSQDHSTYPANVSGGIDRLPASGTRHFVLQSEASDGALALLLSSNMTTQNVCDVVHGPAVYSDGFDATAGDEIFFDWRAYMGSDNYHVFGYIVDEHGVQTTVLDATGGGTSPWATTATTIPADGTYQFVFVAGTHDLTCGRAAGATLIIDNFRVYGSKVTDAVVEQIVHRLQYENISDTPESSRNITVTAVDGTEAASTGTITVDITAVDDPPILDPVTGLTFTNAEGPQTFAPGTGTLNGADADGDAISYSILGGTPMPTTIGGTDYTDAVVGTYGTLHVHSGTGEYVYLPDDSAIDARLTDGSESFTLVATANGVDARQTLNITITVPAAAPAAPVNPSATAQSERVTLTWEAPPWIGGAAVTGYLIEQSSDGGVTWVPLVTTANPATTYVVEGLTNGVEMSFRISAVNEHGIGASSVVVAATPTPETSPAVASASLLPTTGAEVGAFVLLGICVLGAGAVTVGIGLRRRTSA